MHSMTGFGRSILERDGIQCIMEIKTLNNRYRDFYFRLPENVRPLEDLLRQKCQEQILRGRIELSVNIKNSNKNDYIFSIDSELFEKIYNEMNEYSEKYFEREVNFSDLLGFKELFQLEEKKQDEDFLKAILLETLTEALELTIESRRIEGENLKKDLSQQLNNMTMSLEKIERLYFSLESNIRETLRSRLEETIKDQRIDEDRLYQEICFIADRADIHEEIVRLNSHIKYFEQTMEEVGEIGRKLDFITQEMNREINTINSKSIDDKIIKEGIQIKSNIEKIKEQVQNIE